MDRLISCEFNMDNACVELKFLDGSMIAIDTIDAATCKFQFHTSGIHVELTRNQSIHKKPPFCGMFRSSQNI